MLRNRVNEFEVVLDVIPDGPLLIVMGEQELPPEHALSTGASFADGVDEALELLLQRPKAEKEEGGVDNRFVHTHRNGDEEPFLPGSSIKGVLRNQAEQLARTMGQGCCDPFAGVDDVSDEGDVSCSVLLEQRRKALPNEEQQLPGPEIYRMACPVCKLFGCLGLASRLQVTDAHPIASSSFKTATRDGVGIDRRRGGAREQVKFQNEVLEVGRFRTRLRVRNFELWQLGMMAYLLDDLVQGRIRLGHGKHRGLGKISGEIQSVQLSHFGAAALRADPHRVVVSGVGALASSTGISDFGAYGFVPNEGVSIEGVKGERDGLRYCWTFPARQQEALWAAVAPLWRDYAGLEQPEGERRPS